MNIIGKTIANRFEIISKTGVGGMATVYVAKDKVLNRDVAVKVLKDDDTEVELMESIDYGDTDINSIISAEDKRYNSKDENYASMGYQEQAFEGEELVSVSETETYDAEDSVDYDSNEE